MADSTTPPALSVLGANTPIVAAPMAGGPSTPDLVRAAAAVGGLGFLAGAYRDARSLKQQIDTVRASGVSFGLNLFAPNPVPVRSDQYHRYAATIAPEADRYHLDTTVAPIVEDDDHWRDKVDLLVSDPVPLVSFTFAIPPPDVISALRNAGTVIAQTVTSPHEARLAELAGTDLLILQSSAAGGHSGTFSPERALEDVPLTELVQHVRATVRLPIVAAGGIGTPQDVSAILRSGATAVAVGTVLLRSDEAGTTAAHRAALADSARQETVVTRAFTGRPARGLRNHFTDRYSHLAPTGYPALHHLTRPLRKAAAAAGDPDRLHLWAGKGFHHATAEPAETILRRLISGL